MNWVKATRTGGSGGTAIWFNPDNITRITEAVGTGVTTNVMQTDGSSTEVVESAADLLSAMCVFPRDA